MKLHFADKAALEKIKEFVGIPLGFLIFVALISTKFDLPRAAEMVIYISAFIVVLQIIVSLVNWRKRVTSDRRWLLHLEKENPRVLYIAEHVRQNFAFNGGFGSRPPQLRDTAVIVTGVLNYLEEFHDFTLPSSPRISPKRDA